ncbi:hypothetical protein BH747_09965 [Enterococcus villorum]|uniref:Response regulatory domain-containing protein n=1 Tax=Enterococcus villorum TaxID=112904 RepID=A0A1V8YJA0_9ENTE|nr:LytTR family transcriptional regulator DNA-binding domain-containing protein [Enterococcus villorum]OQO69586.1 hypothetical protein BH747_09965 [Enterococcus villorum]OQO72662.1 hypothetical protein BH744_11135 [Enterococcus villorum]
MQNIFIIEDNFLHRKFIENVIHEFTENYKIVVQINAIESVYHFTKKIAKSTISDLDIFFVDIDLNTQYSGVDIAEKIREKNVFCTIIFITSSNDKGIEIISRNITPFDYIHKSGLDITTTKQQIQETLQKVFKNLQATCHKFLVLKNNHENQIFSYTDINYIQTIKGDRSRIYLQTVDQEYLLNENFATIKNKYFPNYFLFLKSYIINLNQIKSINRKIGIITFTSGTEIYASIKILSKITNALEKLL